MSSVSSIEILRTEPGSGHVGAVLFRPRKLNIDRKRCAKCIINYLKLSFPQTSISSGDGVSNSRLIAVVITEGLSRSFRPCFPHTAHDGTSLKLQSYLSYNVKLLTREEGD